MNNQNRLKFKKSPRGVTLIEMTVVILLILMLTGLSVASLGAYRNWSKGTAAGQKLREVHLAQLTFLADNPTVVPGNVDLDEMTANVIAYLSNGAAALPEVEDLDGNVLAIDVTVVPPVFQFGAEGDPSGSTTDGLWDVGE